MHTTIDCVPSAAVALHMQQVQYLWPSEAENFIRQQVLAEKARPLPIGFGSTTTPHEFRARCKQYGVIIRKSFP